MSVAKGNHAVVQLPLLQLSLVLIVGDDSINNARHVVHLFLSEPVELFFPNPTPLLASSASFDIHSSSIKVGVMKGKTFVADLRVGRFDEGNATGTIVLLLISEKAHLECFGGHHVPDVVLDVLEKAFPCGGV